MRLSKELMAGLADVFADDANASQCIEVMACIRIAGGAGFQSKQSEWGSMLNRLEHIGLLTREKDGYALTQAGFMVGDSLRECLWLQEREQSMHSAGMVKAMDSNRYSGDVLEIGSGFGCNLVSLAKQPGRKVALDVIEIYLQLSPLLARYCEVDMPERVVGSGDVLPFKPFSFDHVLLSGSLQYVPIAKTLNEVYRVLNKSGQCLIIVGYVWSTFKAGVSHLFKGEIRPGLGCFKVCIESLLYEYTQRRFVEYAPGESMPRTIFPRIRYLKKLAIKAGFEVDGELTTIFNNELYLVLKKPGR